MIVFSLDEADEPLDQNSLAEFLSRRVAKVRDGLQCSPCDAHQPDVDLFLLLPAAAHPVLPK